MHGRTFKWLVPVLAAAVACAAAGGALAQEMILSDPGYATSASRTQAESKVASNQLVSANSYLASLETRVATLEAALQEEAEEVEWTDVSGENFGIKVGGRIYGDYVLFPDQDAASLLAHGNLQDYFEFRRVRLFIEGEGYGVYDYKLQLDFEPERGLIDDPAVAAKDLYVGIHEIPYLGYVRFGHFKEPFSLEELTSSKYITFMERALPNIFVPSRNVGVCAYNHSEGEAFTWAYGVFFHDVHDEALERVDDRQGVNLTVRGTWNPWYEAEGRGVLHLGGCYTFQDDPDDLVQFRTTPEVHELRDATFADVYVLDTGVFAARHWQVLDFESALVYGPFSLQSELFYTHTDGVAGVADYDFYGAYAYASYFLTGENRVYKRTAGAFSRVTPYTNFWIVRTADGYVRSGWGAWELACRWSYLDLDEPGLAARPKAGILNDITVGVNWHWNPYARMMFEYIHSYGDLNGFGANDTDILGMRMQVDF